MKLTNKQKGILMMSPMILLFGVVVISMLYITIIQIPIEKIVNFLIAFILFIAFVYGAALYNTK